MKKSLLFFAAILIFTSGAFSQEKKNRDSFELKMAVDEEHYFAAKIPGSAYILKDETVQVYPGEELFVEAEISDGNLVNLKNVAVNENPEKTLVIKFEQINEGKKHKCMMLSIFNPFEKELEYSAIILLPKYGRWVETDVIGIKPNGPGYETWPDLISSIALTDWKLKASSKK